ncbi:MULTISPECIES: hypothetical protein [unclassified Pseudoxanthomonas]|uniref:hypothetical protein n=1 Tax=unclassified Pseudoxanthomonas TaxID=2645906 RepID=UPI0030785DB4
MKIRIDFSVSTSGGDAIGHIEGGVDFVVEPVIGDTVSLMFSPAGVGIPKGHELGGQLKVEERVFSPGQKEYPLTLMLSDMVTETRKEAMDILAYMESEFGLHANFYDD